MQVNFHYLYVEDINAYQQYKFNMFAFSKFRNNLVYFDKSNRAETPDFRHSSYFS